MWGTWLATTFHQQLTSVETADFSKLNDSLYATTFLAYGTRRQCCPNCLLPDHSAEDCALYNPTESGIAPMGSVTRGGYAELMITSGHRTKSGQIAWLSDHNSIVQTLCLIKA